MRNQASRSACRSSRWARTKSRSALVTAPDRSGGGGRPARPARVGGTPHPGGPPPGGPPRAGAPPRPPVLSGSGGKRYGWPGAGRGPRGGGGVRRDVPASVGCMPDPDGLLLRVPLDEDAAAWHRLFGDPEVMRYVGSGLVRDLRWYEEFVRRQQQLATGTGLCLFSVVVDG